MTGAQVRTLREALGWTGAQFASLFGVHPSTVYRWENEEGATLKTEPLQLQLLTLLQKAISTEEGLGTIRVKLDEALALGGSLRGLHTLLSDAYEGEDASGHPT